MPPVPSALRQRPLAHWRSRSTLSAAVRATGTTFLAASTKRHVQQGRQIGSRRGFPRRSSRRPRDVAVAGPVRTSPDRCAKSPAAAGHWADRGTKRRRTARPGRTPAAAWRCRCTWRRRKRPTRGRDIQVSSVPNSRADTPRVALAGAGHAAQGLFQLVARTARRAPSRRRSSGPGGCWLRVWPTSSP